MKILLKQITKTFLKNAFLIFGLTTLITSVIFISTAAVQTTLSLNATVNELNNKGKNSQITSKSVGNFGKLSFNYDLANTTPTSILKSSLSIQTDANGLPVFNENILFPYERDDFYTSSGAVKKVIKNNSGVSYDSSTGQVTANNNDANGFWNFSYGSLTNALGLNTDLPVFLGGGKTSALFVGLVSEDNRILLNPQDLLFKSDGTPIYMWNKGSIGSTISYFESFAKPNKNVVINSPLNDSSTAFTRVNNSTLNTTALHRVTQTNEIKPFAYPAAKYNAKNFWAYTLGLYTTQAPAVQYEINLDLENSFGAVKHFIEQYPETLETAFYKLFPILENSENQEIFSIDGKTIKVALDDNYFMKDDNPDIESVKVEYFNNFTNYLSTKLLNELQNIFFATFKLQLFDQDIVLDKQQEYFFNNSPDRHEYLFVKKSNNQNNDVVVKQGINIENSNIEIIKQKLLSTANGFISYDGLMTFIDYLLSSQYTSGNTVSMSGYLYDALIAFTKDLQALLLALPSNTDFVPASIIDSPELKRFATWLAWHIVIEKNNSISIRWSMDTAFTVINSAVVITKNFIDDFSSVVNTAYADTNKKKFLPIKFINKSDEQAWLEFYETIKNSNDRYNLLSSWIANNKNKDINIIPWSFAKQLFAEDPLLFDVWINSLSNKYTINYQDIRYAIVGFGNAPNYAFPIISATSPIPDPQKQAIVYLSTTAFDGLNINNIDIGQYYTYRVSDKSIKKEIQVIENVLINLIGSSDISIASYLDNQDLNIFWLRTYFPYQITLIINLAAILVSIGLIILSVVVIFLLFKALTRNLMQPLSICIANGVAFKKVVFACLINVGIMTTFASILAYLIAFFVQSSLLNIVSPIWFLAQVTLPFNAGILFALIFASFLLLAPIFYLILVKRFKQPIPEILANKEEIRANKLTSIIRNNALNVSSIFKLSFGLSSTKVGRILLLSVLCATCLGGTVSGIIMNDKFNVARTATNHSNTYTNRYDLVNPNEFSGLYKTQPYAEIGLSNPSIGINSIYDANIDGSYIYPYRNDQLRTYIVSEDKQSIQLKEPAEYFSNFVLPSYPIYQQLGAGDANLLFNSVASLFLLDVDIEINLLVTKFQANIWETVKTSFPEWLVYQLESNIKNFKQAVYDQYGEKYLDFLETFTNSFVTQGGNLNLESISALDQGYYTSKFTDQDGVQFTSRPFYLWVDSQQKYMPDYNGTSTIYDRMSMSSGSHTTIALEYYDNNGNLKMPLGDTEVSWTLTKPIENFVFKKDIVEGSITNLNSLSFSQEFLNFVGLIYGDYDLSNLDSKASFGIIPVEQNGEIYTKINGEITSLENSFGHSYKPDNASIEILGIVDNSKFINVSDDKQKNLYPSFKNNINIDNGFNIVVNQGAAYKYGLKIGDRFNVDLTNNIYNKSYDVMNSFITISDSIHSNYEFRVSGINTDSFGEKFYIDQPTANKLIQLDKLQTNIKYNSDSVVRESNLEIAYNGFFINQEIPTLLNKAVSFYSETGFWNTSQTITNIKTLPTDVMFDVLITQNEDILKSMADSIKKIDDNFDNTITGDNLRKNIILYFKQNYDSANLILNKLVTPLNNLNLIVGVQMMNSMSLTNQLFNTMSSLSNTIIVIGVSILMPILILISLISILSIINDYIKLIGLMRVLGFSNKNIGIIISSMFIPILLLTTILGCGIMFATTYGLQFLIFMLTSIFVSPFVQAGSFVIGLLGIAGIIAICIGFLQIVINRQNLQTAIKF